MARSRSRDPLQERVLDVILDAAARVMAERGEAASMSDVASAAGVARATLYRYFGSRQALEDEVVVAGATRAHDGLRAGRIAEIGVADGVPRAVRTMLEVGHALVVIARRRAVAPVPDFEMRVTGELRRLLHEGQAAGEVRDDLPAAWLAESLLALVVNAVASPPGTGREDTVTAVSGFFLEGAGGRATRRAADRADAMRAGGDDE
jgi:TetR/AcrR family transcriptional repressor of mexCD-oprJ operon